MTDVAPAEVVDDRPRGLADPDAGVCRTCRQTITRAAAAPFEWYHVVSGQALSNAEGAHRALPRSTDE